jgi:hypothetical protein
MVCSNNGGRLFWGTGGMTERYNNIYRIESSRKPGWDYSQQGAYFITVCTAKGDHCFGHIDKRRMILSDIGRVAEEEWLKTPDIRPDMNLTLDSYCIMPNHVHGIIIIGENRYNRDQKIILPGFGPQRKNYWPRQFFMEVMNCEQSNDKPFQP